MAKGLGLLRFFRKKKNVVFICYEELLTDEQFKGLQSQINAVWPEGIERPILLDGGATVKVIEV